MFASGISSRSAFAQTYLQCFVFLSVLMAVFGVLSPHFFSLENFDNILSASAVLGLLALGSTFVIASGGIDLSIASIMALAGVVCATVVFESNTSASVALLLCVAIGGVCGATNGFLVNLTKAPSFIVTLGTMSVFRAFSFIASDGMPIYGLPSETTWLGQETVMLVSGPVLVLSIAVLAAHLLLHTTRFGSRALVYGDRSATAEAVGIPTHWLRVQVFGVSGLFAGAAGYIFMARTNAGDPTAGMNYELIAITAVVLGGAKLYGGKATVIGTLLGVLCLGTLQNGLSLLAVSTYYQILFVGGVLIVAAFLDRVGK